MYLPRKRNTAMSIKGFRENSKLYQEQVRKIVTKEAQGFLLAGAVGGFVGACAGGVLTAFFTAIVIL